MQSLVAAQRDLAPIAAHPRHPDRHLLPHQQDNPTISRDGEGGAFVAWRDFRTYDTDGLSVFAQHFDVDRATATDATLTSARMESGAVVLEAWAPPSGPALMMERRESKD